MAVSYTNITPSDFDVEGKVNAAASTASNTVGEGPSHQGLIDGKDSGGTQSFVGLDFQGYQKFNDALDKYIQGVQEVLDGFNTNPDMEDALKGAAATTFEQFLKSLNNLLGNYLSALNEEKKELHEAFINFQKAEGQIATNVSDDAVSLNGINIQ